MLVATSPVSHKFRFRCFDFLRKEEYGQTRPSCPKRKKGEPALRIMLFGSTTPSPQGSHPPPQSSTSPSATTTPSEPLSQVGGLMVRIRLGAEKSSCVEYNYFNKST